MTVLGLALTSTNASGHFCLRPSDVAQVDLQAAARRLVDGVAQSSTRVRIATRNSAEAEEAMAYDRVLTAPMSEAATRELSQRFRAGTVARRKVRSNG
ncbi:hypothetical protein [[Kitasatospora] papulosa]|uniref:hypothetical protein n=1 Tax=[Kitasatospora] papulosa TaxID=1464011 RepID=UPI0036294BD5